VRRAFQALLVIAVAAGCYVTRELRLAAFHSHLASQSYEDRYYLPPAEWLPLMSLGFRAALADLIWCRSLIYFGEELVHKGGVKFAFEYTDAVLALDPDFRSAYAWIGTAALYRAKGVTYEDGLRATSYLKRAVDRWPSDGDLHWRYASILRFELAPMLKPGPQKDHLIALSAPHLVAAANLGAGPAWLSLNSVALLERLGQKEQAIRHMEEVYGTVQDERTKRLIEDRLREMRSESFVEALRTANQELESERLASYPYLTPSMFILVGPRYAQREHELVRYRFLPPLPDVAAEAPGSARELDEKAR
jgi:tetratricopeptide (TPR) repeat protein